MDIDIAQIRYHTELVTETGDVYNLDGAVLSLAWEEQEGQLAQKATLKLANYKMESGEYLMALAKLNRYLLIYANWGEGEQKLFEGTLWEWQYASAQNKEISLVAYDPMIRLQQSKDFKYFSAGLTTPAILGSICGDWGITLDYKWSQQMTHEKKVFNCEAVSDMIVKLLEEVRQQTGVKYAALYRDGKLEVTDYGTNQDIYLFDGNNSISTSNKLTLDNLVTRVKIIGKAEDDERSSVDAVVDGNLEYGVLQEVILRDGDKDIGKAKSEAQATLDERGQPEESIMVTAPDVPFIRRGDAVEVSAGNLTGLFLVKGISHNATSKQMTMTLMRQPEPKAQSQQAQAQEDGNFKQGDSVILNGPVYVDSYGNGKGRTFTNYKSTITIVAPLERACPYHIGQIGWVYPNEITKA